MDKLSNSINRITKEYLSESSECEIDKNSSKMSDAICSAYTNILEQQAPEGVDAELPPTQPPVEAEPPPPPEIDSKPYTWLAYIAFKCLQLDPAEVSQTDIYDDIIQEIGDINDKSDIQTPEQALMIFEALNELINSTQLPSPAEN